MDTLARAILFATNYIDKRAGDDPDDDVAALEEISVQLKNASAAEMACLVRLAKELNMESWLDEMGLT